MEGSGKGNQSLLNSFTKLFTEEFLFLPCKFRDSDEVVTEMYENKMQKYLAIEHNEYGTFTMSFSYTMLSVIPSIYVHVVRAAHLPVNNVMLSFIIVHTLLPACSLGTLEPCIMELNVVARALVDVLV